MGARGKGSSDPIGFLFVLCFFVLIIIFSIISEKKEKKRNKDMLDYCKKNKIEYSEYAKNLPSILNFCLLLKEKGEINKRIKEMSGVRGDYNFYLFEYYYESGSGKSRTEGTDTLCVIKKEGFIMPQFFVRSERLILDSFGKLLGEQDINFEEDPEFSRSFILRGKKERDVRSFFDSRVRSAFVRGAINGYKYEGIENCFVVSVSGKMDLENRLKLLSNTMNVFREIVPEEQEEYLS